MYPPGWPKCPHCDEYALDGKVTCGRAECSIKEYEDKRAGAALDLAAAVAFAKEQHDDLAILQAVNDYVAKNYPLPRCDHGNALRDHAGELLFPSCGCRLAS